MSKTVAFHTLGCKVNSYETEAMLQLFMEAGYKSVDFKEEALVYVINTCTVTNSGDSKSRQIIRRAIRNNSNAVICVVGCYAQVSPEEIEAIEGVDIIIGTQYRNQIVELVEDSLLGRGFFNKVQSLEKEIEFEDLNVNVFTENTRAFLKIQDGCNNYCTYCIIPYARGNIRSRKKIEVIKQAKKLVENGFYEIVLTGIHTAGYGTDFKDYSFSDLLVDLINEVKGLKRLRISSIEFSQIDQKLIDLIVNNHLIVNHLHIPLQAGSNQILKKMNRKYSVDDYAKKITDIREKIPNIAITTDVIVGFPGESADLFKEAYEFIESIGFSGLHVFPYSKRKNTPAAKMVNQVTDLVKSTRVKELLMLSNQLRDRYIERQINLNAIVLVEEKKGEYYLGHTSNYLKVKFKSDKSLINKMVNVQLIKHKDGIIIGNLLE